MKRFSLIWLALNTAVNADAFGDAVSCGAVVSAVDLVDC